MTSMRKLERLYGSLQTQVNQLAASSRDGGADSTTIEAERLRFFSDYLARARQDAMSDKDALTHITYLKVLVFAALFGLNRGPTASIGLALLPLVLFSLDYLHKSRFNEIFDRWYHLEEMVVPRIKKHTGDGFLFFEELVVNRSRRGDYALSEGVVRTVMTALSVVGTVPICGAYLGKMLSLEPEHATRVSLAWAVILGLIYWTLFGLQPRYRNAHLHPAIIPAVLGIVSVILLLWGPRILAWYDLGLAVGR